MAATDDFERILILFRRARALPDLPAIAVRLIQAVDSGTASATELEKIIAADPILAARILRIANTGAAGFSSAQITTIRQAIMKLGQRSVKNLAVSLVMDRVTSRTPAGGPCPKRVAGHSLVTAFLARYLFARQQRKQEFASAWTADEVFAAGLLHEISLPLLYQAAPDVFNRIRLTASRMQITYEAAFERIYSQPMSVLAGEAMEYWGLPDVFIKARKHLSEPWTYFEEFTALSCLNCADGVACMFGSSAEPWPLSVSIEPEVAGEVSLEDEEASLVMDLIRCQVEDYLNPASAGLARCA